MIDLIELPEFDIPEYVHKHPPNEVVYEWISQNIRMLKESGQMDRIRKQESRQPVDVPFIILD